MDCLQHVNIMKKIKFAGPTAQGVLESLLQPFFNSIVQYSLISGAAQGVRLEKVYHSRTRRGLLEAHPRTRRGSIDVSRGIQKNIKKNIDF